MLTPWKESKDAGQQAFQDGNYNSALLHYEKAIDELLTSTSSSNNEGGNNNNNSYSSSHKNEHQVLLSNVIACRLKIGGVDMATLAVEDGKKCVALNNKWSKAHVRLASAYIALGNHSNDACLSLQRALSLDKNNKVARDMLVKEMRQRNNRERTGESSSGVSGSERSEQEERNNEGESASTPLPTPSAPPPEQSSQSTNNDNGDGRSSINYDGIDVDDVNTPPSLSFTERIQYYFAEFLTWFDSQSDDIKTLVKVGFCFLILYVALGGRFGLDYALGGGRGVSTHRGTYGAGNAYDRYYNDQYKERSYDNDHRNNDPHRRTTTSDSSGYNDRTTKQNAKYYSQYQNNGDNNDYYEPPPRKTRRSTASYHMPNLFDGSMSSMGILLAIGLACHYAGINPMQVMMMLNMMNGRRGHRGFGGYGGYNMGGGFGRRRRYGGRRGRW